MPAMSRFQGSLVSWEQAGLPAEDAVHWWAAGTFPVSQGAAWWRAGYSPQQATFVEILTRFARLAGPSADVSAPAAWRISGLPAHVVCLCLAAGIHSVPEARGVNLALVLRPEMYAVLTDKAAQAGFDPWQQSFVASRSVIGVRWRVHAQVALCRVIEAGRTVAFSRAQQARASRARSRPIGSGHP